MKFQGYTLYVASKDNQTAVPEPQCYLIDYEYNNNIATNDWVLCYKQITLMLESNTPSSDQNNQFSLCYSFLPSPFNPEHTFENRYIKIYNPFAEANLIYLQNFANQILLNKQYPPFYPYFSTSNSGRTGECSHENKTMEFNGDTN